MQTQSVFKQVFFEYYFNQNCVLSKRLWREKKGHLYFDRTRPRQSRNEVNNNSCAVSLHAAMSDCCRRVGEAENPPWATPTFPLLECAHEEMQNRRGIWKLWYIQWKITLFQDTFTIFFWPTYEYFDDQTAPMWARYRTDRLSDNHI